MDKFIIKCPQCGNNFNLTKHQISDKYPQTIYFNELNVADYNDHIKLNCPKCGYYETDKEG